MEPSAPTGSDVAAPDRSETTTDWVVSARRRLADGVVELTLADPDGRTLTGWSPGAHIDLLLGDIGARQYSLSGASADRRQVRIAVLREPHSRGGSVFVHEQLMPGERVRVRGPRNHFPLLPSPRYVFIAGGIGITPILPMIAAVASAGADWQLMYGGRSRRSLAFLDELAGYADRVGVHPQDETGLLDFDAVLAEPREDTLVYCCGPEGLLAAVETRCAAWPEDALHVERFAPRTPVVVPPAAEPFEVVLARSGMTLVVGPDDSILDACFDAGIDVLSSCEEGTCGTCVVRVLAGTPDHRDSVLSDSERRRNESMAICVSRSLTPSLTLDL